MADPIAHESQTAQPGEFAEYLASKQTPAEKPPATDAVVEEPPVEKAEPVKAEPVQGDGWEDPETHERIEHPGRADKRIKRLWNDRLVATQRADRLEQELAELRSQLAGGSPAAPLRADPAAPTDAAPDELTAAAQARIRSKPNRAEIGTTYPTYEDYVEDCAIWGGELAAEKRAMQSQQSQQAAAETARQTAFGKDVSVARADYDDFDEVTSQELPTNQAIWDATINAPDGLKGHVLYYLGAHPDETRRIAALPAGPALVAMGELIATVKAERAAKAKPASPSDTKPRSRAPAPLTPAGRNGGGPTRPEQIADTSGNPVDYIRLRNEQTAGMRRL